MAFTSFAAFGEALCKAAGAAVPDLQADRDQVAAFHLVMQGVAVNFQHVAIEGNDDVFVHVVFGPIPPEQELAALRAIACANFSMVAAAAPVFGRHPVSGEVVLRKLFSLSRVDTVAALNAVRSLVKLALEWRENPAMQAEGEAQARVNPGVFA